MSTVGMPGRVPTLTGSIDREGREGLTKLGEAAYKLFLPDVCKHLDAGADPDKLSSFAGGSSPLLLAIAGYCDKAEDCAPAHVPFFARECVQILEALRAAEARFVLPESVYFEPTRVLELVDACLSAGLEDLRLDLIQL